MNEEWWESPTCFICDYGWALLAGILLLLSAYFTRAYWLPSVGPPTLTAPPAVNPTLALGTGDIQVTLQWDTLNDLDLYVTDPSGENIYYQHPTSLSGGILDVDANRNCLENMTGTPVENIYWPTGAAPSGTFQIAVNYYRHCSAAPLEDNYTVRALVDGQVQVFTGTLNQEQEYDSIYEFTR
jgi:hypothetical protein